MKNVNPNGLAVAIYGPYTDWEAFCEEQHYPPGGTLSKNPKFGWAKKHASECGHQVLVRVVREWAVKPD